MIDRWIDSLTIKQALIVFFGAIATIGVLVSLMALSVGCSWLAAFLAGLATICVVLSTFLVRLVIKTWWKIRTNVK